MRMMILFLLLLGSLPLQAMPFGGPSHVKVEVVPESSTYEAGADNWVAIRLQMEPNWHVYWKNVGDSGLATQFEFQLPPGMEVKELLWPTPELFDTQGLVSYGYSGEAIWLANLTGGAPGQVNLQVDWLECEEVCIPGSAKTSFSWTGGPGDPALFERARAAIPMATENFGEFSVRGQSLVWRPPHDGVESWTFFPEDDGWLIYAEPQVYTPVEGLKLALEDDADTTQPLRGVMVGTSQGQVSFASAGTWQLGATGAQAEPSGATEAPPLALMLLFAFIGGLLLNIMPCVLPVLSIKIMQLLDHRDGGTPLPAALAYTAGVLISFTLLALGLILLRGAGAELGWGFQLQNPLVICFLMGLFLLLGLNMFGLFEIGLGLVGVDERAKGKGKLLSIFGSGALATAAATPCSAPFMGAAVGYALTLDAAASLLIFFFLGLGMAFPFLMVGFFPAALKLLPKPGAWMLTFKQFMGFLLMATVAYLFHVLVTLVDDSDRILNVGLALVLLAFGAWVYGKGSGWLNRVLVVLSLAGTVWMMGPTNKHIPWEEFDEKAIEKHVGAGRPVFIDFTASWCTNCKVNERRVLETPETLALLQSTGVVPMKGDWSNLNEDISRYLAKLGRNSVPVYAVIDPRAPDRPKLLPEALLFSHLEDAFESLSQPLPKDVP